jgi:hypothetical protein
MVVDAGKPAGLAIGRCRTTGVVISLESVS